MLPDRSNYEIWFIDYLDGNLDETRINQLFPFLEKNPDLRQELEEISGIKISPVGNSSVNKSHLKKTYSDLSSEQFDFLCVAAAENDLDEEQKVELGEIINQNSERRKTLGLIKKIKLTASDVKFNRKSSLRKLTSPQKVFRLSVIVISAAACLAIMISLFNLAGKSKKEIPVVAASSSTNVIKPDVREKIVPANIPGRENKAETKPAIISVQNTLNKSAAVEIPPVKTEQSPVNISKTDYKHEVTLVKNSFAGILAVINTAVIFSAEPIEKPGLNTLIARLFREKILKSRDLETGSLKPYEIADAGILGLNKLLGWQMSLQKKLDDKGDLKSLYFSSRILKFNAPVRKVQLEP
jgi:hypothetical protein